jgi:hypothetical protein
MPEKNVLDSSSIFLSILCGIFVIFTIVFNFTFLVILFKMKRLFQVDKSNLFVTSMLMVDFLCSFFILIPSGYGVYNDYFLNKPACRLHTWFTTFFFCMTFQGLFLVSIERFLRYKAPIWHINFFTKRIVYDDEGIPAPANSEFQTLKVLLILLALWLFNIFISFIPIFGNIEDVQYFFSQSQCNYIYENFSWWLWVYFIIFVTLPFIGSLIFFFLALRIAELTRRMTKMNRTQYEVMENNRKKTLREKNMAEYVVDGLDITLQPGNKLYYSHVLDPDRIPEDLQNDVTNDFHVRNELLALYKHDTERGKLITFIVITLVTYCLFFPLMVIHFYRTYNNGNSPDEEGSYDDPSVVARPTYTAFVWISYASLLVKSMICLLVNKFYRHQLYQSMNIRGFKGYFDYEKDVNIIKREFDSAVGKIDFSGRKRSGHQNLTYNESES